MAFTFPATFPCTSPPRTAPASQQSSFQAGSEQEPSSQAASSRTKPADQPSGLLPQAFAAVFGAARAAGDAPSGGALPCARHSTPSRQAAPTDNGTKLPDNSQNLAAAAFGGKTTTGGTGLFGASGMKPSGDDFSAAIKDKRADGPFVFNLTAAAGHEPTEPLQTASDKAAPTVGIAADGVTSITDPSAASGFATGPAPAAASRNPPAASGTPSAADGALAAASSRLQPTEGVAAEHGTPQGAGFGRPTPDSAATDAADQRGSAFTFGSQAPTRHSAEPSLFGDTLSTSHSSAPTQGGFPLANPFLVSGFPSVSSGEAATAFAFSQQKPVSANAAQHVPQLFSFGQGVSSVTEPGASCAGEQHAEAAGQQADAGQSIFGFDAQAAAASSPAGAISAQSRSHSKPKHHARK